MKPKPKYNGAHLQKWGSVWQAKVDIKGSSVHLGFFNTPEDAYAAWLVAKKKKKDRSWVQRMIDKELKFLFTPRSDEEIAARGIDLKKRRRSSTAATCGLAHVVPSFT